MSYIIRPVARWAAFAGVTLASSSGFAWVETQIRGYGATVDVDADGRAVVAHELVMSVRGGPLKRIEIPGVDSDAEPLPDATVTPTVQGAASLPLLVERRDDGVLLLEVDHEKGLRGGRYAFAFRHRTDLRARGLIQRRGESAELRWQSPRFEQGIDSMRIVFRLPPLSTAPKLPTFDNHAEASFGAFIETLRRAPDKDELEIVRPHVAENEAVVWRAVVGPELAPVSQEPAQAPAAAPRATRSVPIAPALDRLRGFGILSAIALVYGLLVFWKGRTFERACQATNARLRALVPLPEGFRAAGSGVSLAAAVAMALAFESPTVAGCLLVAALALAALRSPEQRPVLRGPGRWLPLSESEAFQRRADRRPGAWLDATRLPGFLLFAIGVAASVGGAAWLLPRSAYDALLALLTCSVLVPVFLTGRAVDLRADPVTAPRRLFRTLLRRLNARAGIKVVPWARLSDATGEADELRLLVQLKPAPTGLVALEIGVEPVRGLGGTVLVPYVLVRAKEGSPAHQALAATTSFSRGRKPEERVAILRPWLPTTGGARSLVLAVIAVLERGRRDGQPSSSSRARSGAGRSERTAKLGSVRSPAHAM